MSRFVIEGQSGLCGEIDVQGSKNAALPLMAASLMTAEPVTIQNVPAIRDVASLCEILASLGVEVSREEGAITLKADSVNANGLDMNKVGSLRGSVLLMGALLARGRSVKLPLPGGDIIGARPIDVHLDAFEQLGAKVNTGDGLVEIDGTNMQAGEVTLRELSVTATENVILAAAALPGETILHLAAAEPHVEALAELVTAMGARVIGAGTHTIRIEGKEILNGAEVVNIPDMIEAGTFILLGIAAGADLRVNNVPAEHLRLFFKILSDMGANVAVRNGIAQVKAGKLKPFKIQTLPHPGLASDLQAPFSVLATQADGASLIHDPMYEGRFKYADELMKMGAAITVCDPHRIIIEGPRSLYGRHIKSLDIRAGMTLLMAGLIAQGTTVIDDAEIIDRGYADLDKRLTSIGAKIVREPAKEAAAVK